MDSQLVQDSISDNQVILERIKYELNNATEEILVAMAWFTNNELLDILCYKQRQHVRVSLIVADQPDNQKLDFTELEQLGADFTKVKNVGWGMMHQKFCVIDKKTAITGSYNWSNNAKNNHENVIVTNHKKTVDQLIDTFLQIKDRAIRINNGETMEDIEKQERIRENTQSNIEDKSIQNDSVSFQGKSLNEFKTVLNSIIASEVGSIDKDFLKRSGYNRASESLGDHQILSQAMDSLYSNFINEIEVVEVRKKRLKATIEEQQKISISNVELKTENEIKTLKQNVLVEAQNIEDDIRDISKKVDSNRLEIKSNTDTKIPILKEKITALRNEIDKLGFDFVKPPINWPKMILLSIMSFFSSTLYFCFLLFGGIYFPFFERRNFENDGIGYSNYTSYRSF